MNDETTDMMSVHEIEILTPENGDHCRGGPSCLCCGQSRSMEDDGCGICDECLSP